MTIGSWELKFKLESDLGWYFCFLMLGCRSVLSIVRLIEGSRCHSWSDQYTDLDCYVWLLGVQSSNCDWNRISDSIFVFWNWCATLSSRSWAPLRDRDAIREAINIQSPSDFLSNYWEFRARILIGIRTRMLFFLNLVCRSVLSIAETIEGSRCHSWSDQYTDSIELSFVIIKFTCNVIY